ncbi:hypothetical protein [Chitinophaga sp. Cy-1792]|uniref:hypothetical protein n=1 Tax=Chitinophaga sp. Cy-1792 TaxID=2608339 RepID=UPI00141E524C|nr:hypothetical protein [Chitinophaga sp. Cy-1792]NIG57684.1 hypothetical protein [Chitinophaga sp. Cy-1792]
MIKHLLVFSFVLGSAAVQAQTTKPASAKTPAAKPATHTPAGAAVAAKRPMKLVSTWGIFLGDSLPKNEIVKLLDSSLIVRDEKNVKYPVISFAFTLEQHEPYLNDTTGQPAIYKDYTGDNFKQAKMTTIWANGLKANLGKGDILFFDEILVQQPNGKVYKAPSLKFTVR